MLQKGAPQLYQTRGHKTALILVSQVTTASIQILETIVKNVSVVPSFRPLLYIHCVVLMWLSECKKNCQDCSLSTFYMLFNICALNIRCAHPPDVHLTPRSLHTSFIRHSMCEVRRPRYEATQLLVQIDIC